MDRAIGRCRTWIDRLPAPRSVVWKSRVAGWGFGDARVPPSSLGPISTSDCNRYRGNPPYWPSIRRSDPKRARAAESARVHESQPQGSYGRRGVRLMFSKGYGKISRSGQRHMAAATTLISAIGAGGIRCQVRRGLSTVAPRHLRGAPSKKMQIAATGKQEPAPFVFHRTRPMARIVDRIQSDAVIPPLGGTGGYSNRNELTHGAQQQRRKITDLAR